MATAGPAGDKSIPRMKCFSQRACTPSLTSPLVVSSCKFVPITAIGISQKEKELKKSNKHDRVKGRDNCKACTMEDWKLGLLLLPEVWCLQSRNLELVNLFAIRAFKAFLYWDTMHLQIYLRTVAHWYIMYTEYQLPRDPGVSNLNSPLELPPFFVCYLCISKGWLHQFNSDNLVSELCSHLISLVLSNLTTLCWKLVIGQIVMLRCTNV